MLIVEDVTGLPSREGRQRKSLHQPRYDSSGHNVRLRGCPLLVADMEGLMFCKFRTCALTIVLTEVDDGVSSLHFIRGANNEDHHRLASLTLCTNFRTRIDECSSLPAYGDDLLWALRSAAVALCAETRMTQPQVGGMVCGSAVRQHQTA